MADLRIDLAAEFRGKKAFKEADQAVSGLDRAVGKLGKQIAGVFAAQKLYAFGKASVKAFAQDEAAAARLATAVDNLGLSFSQTRVTDFIQNLEKTSGIVDDVLRPAMQALLTTTGSLTKSQELLNNAIQISRASGIDLATVSQDLANGYVGITRGLKKYNTGLTQAELKSKSFNEVLGIMLAKSAGAADAYLTTTSYKLDVLNVAADNAKETIGKGLVDAFAKMSNGTTASDAAKTIDNIAKAINGITSAVGGAIGALTRLYQKIDSTTKKIHDNYPDPFGLRDNANKMPAGRSSSPAGTYARVKQQKEAEAAAAKRAKELAALQAKQVKASKALTAEQKKQAALKKAGTVFDLEQIQLVAALKGKLSEDEKLRVEAQLALLNGNVEVAKKLTDQILAAQDSSGNLAKFLAALPDARNPFQYLDAYLSYLAGKAASIATGTPFGQAQPNGNTQVSPTIPDTNVPSYPSDNMITYNPKTGLNYNPNANNNPPAIINVTVQGSVIKEQELIAQIQNGTQLASLSGSPSQIGRIAGMFG